MRKRDRWLAPDLTPLIDIVFLLLIFFMVSSVFKKDQTILDIDLPVANSKSTQQKQETCTIELNDKSLAYQGKKTSFEDFETTCKSISNKKRVNTAPN